MKKILLVLIVIVTVAMVALSVTLRNAPDMLVSAFERQWDKDITVDTTRFQFPATVHMSGVTVNERNRFQEENSLYIKDLSVVVNPYPLFRRRLVVERIYFDSPQVTIRKHRGELFHAFAKAAPARPLAVPEEERPREAPMRPGMAIEIHEVEVKEGVFRFIDYDIDQKGFAVTAQNLTINLKDYFSDDPYVPISFMLEGDLVQGRDLPPAKIEGQGWLRLEDMATDTNLNFQGVWLPYFDPYYQKISPSRIKDGVLDVHSTTIIQNADWTTNARANIRRLQFEAYEENNQILGFDADSILEILRDHQGQIALDIVVRWDLKDPEMTFEKALRKSIRHSVKSTFLLHVDRVVEKALDRISEEGPDVIKEDWQNLIQDEKIQNTIIDFLEAIE